MAFEREQQWFGRHGGDHLQRHQRLASGLPHPFSILVTIENNSIDRLIGRPRFWADRDAADLHNRDLRTRPELRRTARESLIRCSASARQLGIGRSLIGVRADASTKQTAGVDTAI